MEITPLGFILGMLLLAPPLYILYHYRINAWKKAVTALLKMLVVMAMTAFFLKYIIAWNNILFNILWFLLTAIVASTILIIKGKLRMRRFFLPVCTGIMAGSLPTALYLMFLSFGIQNPIDAQFFIPILGLFFGNMVVVNSKALTTYYAGMNHHTQLYDYLLGNGATHTEATHYIMRRTIEKTALPGITHLGGIVISSSPVIMWTMILDGISVVNAAMVQILIIVAMLCSSIMSIVITLYIYRRYTIGV